MDHLQEIKDIKINYTGVDISNELLKIAKKSVKNKDMQCIFVCDDIVDYIKT
ncbi:class I SAM-dependent methyltransferase [Patescibacteria group bacterium]|nr:class I SAM-dependent methyltransferase [Patescibacteria group bacterium]MBU1758303.1 class I SAM-dependent methyltransferase [Patescibacteria group bacterium]